MRGSLLFAVASVAAFGAIAHRRDARPRSEPAASRTRIVLLGTGTPNADPDRAGPALAIVVDSSVYLVDAGAGIVRRAAAAARDDSIPALGAAHLRIDFLTHLHSDHTVGLPDLMFSPWVLGRTAPLDVYGPPGTASMIDHLDAAYAEDVDIRLHGGEPSNKTGYGGRAHEVAPGIVYRDALVRVTAFAVQHGAWPHAYGYRFDTPDRSIVISGDTRPSEAVVRACDGCDVLVHEVYLSSALDTRSADWQAYHHAYHTTSLELGGIAARTRPKLLVLYHLLPPGVSDSALIADVRQTFSGAVRVGRDLGVY
jgi:ribonuclease Z